MKSRFSALVTAPLLLSLVACSDDSLNSDDIEHYRTAWVANSILASEVLEAEERLSRLCMEEKGFDEHPSLTGVLEEESDLMSFIQPRPTPEEAAEVGFSERFPDSVIGHADEAELEGDQLPNLERYDEYRYGIETAEAYHGPGSLDVPRTADDEPLEWPGKEIVQLEDGSVISWHLDGCMGEVIDRLYDGDPHDFKRKEALATARPFEEFNNHDQVMETDQEWSDCMDNAGYPGMTKPYDVLEPLASKRNELTMQLVESDEREISDSDFAEYEELHFELAVIDAECAAETVVDEVHEEAFGEVLADQLSTNETEVFAYADEADAVLEKAQEILAESSW